MDKKFAYVWVTFFVLGIWLRMFLSVVYGQENLKDNLKENVVEKESLQQKLLSDPQVKSIYDGCRQQYPSSKGEMDTFINTCMWQEIEKNQALKEKVLKFYDSSKKEKQGITKNDKTNESTFGTSLAHISTATTKEVNKTPEIRKLEEFLSKRLDEALWGKEGDKSVKNVDHMVFYKLYESQLGKNLLTAVSSYCIEADTEFFIIENEDQAKENRKKNLVALKEGKSAGNKWGTCLKKIPEICETDKDYSKNRACEVVSYMKTVRANLLLITDVKQKAEDALSASSAFKIKDPVRSYSGTSQNDELGIDSLTSITSSEIENSGMEQEAQKRAEKFRKDCIGGGDCSKHLKDEKESEKIRELYAEEALRAKVLEEKLKTMSDEEVKAYLKEEGKTDLVEGLDASKISAIKEEISKKYQAEREAILAKMSENLQKTSKMDDTDKNKLAEEIKEKGLNTSDLFFYNNIVSGYLNVESGDCSSQGKKARKCKTSGNTASLFREIKDFKSDAKMASNRATGDKSSRFDIISELKKAIEKDGIKDTADTKRDDGEVSLGIKTINDQILTYNSEEKDDEKKKQDLASNNGDSDQATPDDASDDGTSPNYNNQVVGSGDDQGIGNHLSGKTLEEVNKKANEGN